MSSRRMREGSAHYLHGPKGVFDPRDNVLVGGGGGSGSGNCAYGTVRYRLFIS